MFRNRADVDLDRRRELLTDHRLHGLAEHVVNRELKRFHSDPRILAVQLFLPQLRQFFFGQKCVEQSLDRIGVFVPSALLTAAEFFVTFIARSFRSPGAGIRPLDRSNTVHLPRGSAQ